MFINQSCRETSDYSGGLNFTISTTMLLTWLNIHAKFMFIIDHTHTNRNGWKSAAVRQKPFSNVKVCV